MDEQMPAGQTVPLEPVVSTGCGYQGREFGATYEDGICIDGYLWDLDSCDVPGGPLTHGGEEACPECNHEEWLADVKDSAVEKGWIAADEGVEASQNAYNIVKLRYEADRETLKGWWAEGHAQRLSELSANA